MNNDLMKRSVVLYCLTIALTLLPGCKPDQGSSKVRPAQSNSDVVAHTTQLATLESHDNDSVTLYFNHNGSGAAYVTKTGEAYRVTHNGRVSGALQSIDKLVISPDGTRVAYSAMVNEKWRMYIDGVVGVPSDEVNDPVFSHDSRHIAYAAKNDKTWNLVVDGRVNPETRAYISSPAFNADASRLIYSEKDTDAGTSRLVISDLAYKKLFVKESCGNNFVFNKDKTRLATTLEKANKQSVVRLDISRPDSLDEGALFDAVQTIVFGNDGNSLAYIGIRGEQRILVVNNKETILPEGNIPGAPVVRPDGKGAGIIVSSAKGFFLYQTVSDSSSKDNGYEEATDLAYSNTGGTYAFAARNGTNWFVVVNGVQGPLYDRVVSPIFSPDGGLLIYRARKDGRRFIVVADARNGKIVRQQPAYDQVFQPVFTSDGKSIAYGVKDGQKIVWKVEKL